MPKVTFITHDGQRHDVPATPGQSLMRAAVADGMPGIDGDGRGGCACGTCRVCEDLTFGFGIHRCVGNRLAELQLKNLWEAFLKRFTATEVMAEPLRMRNNFVRGYCELLVRVPG